LDIFKGGSISRKTINVKQNDDLEQLTDRTEYEGYIIKDIYAIPGNEYIDFTSKDDVIKLGESIGNIDDKQIKTALIGKTIEEHLNKELVLNPQGIKVLSLFFIDSVSKYRTYDEDGNQSNGEYAEIFEKEYERLIRKPKYSSLFGELKLINQKYIMVTSQLIRSRKEVTQKINLSTSKILREVPVQMRTPITS
jgi:type III restriction enzyme